MRIVLVEDLAIVRMDIQNMLQELGYEVVATASSGRKALECIASEKPDLVVVDIGLKGDIDGIETALRIKGRFNIPFIYITGNTDNATIENARNSDPLAMVFKPVNKASLQQAMSDAMKKRNNLS